MSKKGGSVAAIDNEQSEKKSVSGGIQGNGLAAALNGGAGPITTRSGSYNLRGQH